MLKKQKKTGVAPYTKYRKRPFVYLSANCSHASSVKQTVRAPNGVLWKGTACSRCNIILSTGQ